MRKLVLLGAISLAATVVAAELQPLNVKPGLWQVTTTTAYQGMGAPQTKTYQSCVTKDDLNHYPFPDRDNACEYKVLSSTATHMLVGGNCVSQGSKADFKIQLDVVDSEDVNGTGQLTIASPQVNVHADYTGKGKWIGASCSAGTK